MALKSPNVFLQFRKQVNSFTRAVSLATLTYFHNKHPQIYVQYKFITLLNNLYWLLLFASPYIDICFNLYNLSIKEK